MGLAGLDRIASFRTQEIAVTHRNTPLSTAEGQADHHHEKQEAEKDQPAEIMRWENACVDPLVDLITKMIVSTSRAAQKGKTDDAAT